MESVNKQCASNARSAGLLTTDQQALRHQLETTKYIADRALQMCNDLVARVSALEMRKP